MIRFFSETIQDMHHGQQSWRVFATLCAPTFLAALLLNLVRF